MPVLVVHFSIDTRRLTQGNLVLQKGCQDCQENLRVIDLQFISINLLQIPFLTLPKFLSLDLVVQGQSVSMVRRFAMP